MYISILSIGNELVKGRTVNTNATEISAYFTSLGFQINFVLSCRDIPEDIGISLDYLLSNSDAVITTGGLGPTVDDITIQSICSHLGYEITKHDKALGILENKFQANGIKLTPERLKMAFMPRNADILDNEVGTAPGMILRHNGKIIFSTPGVPMEMRSMLKQISTYLGSSGLEYYSSEFKLLGIMESSISPIMRRVMKNHGGAMNIKSHPESLELKHPVLIVEIYGFGKSRIELVNIAKDMKSEIMNELKKIDKD